ncbi:MAG: DUF3604 domain-containing protein [Pseudomonadota bacterium]
MRTASLGLAALLAAASSWSESPLPAEKPYRVFWGDTHVHSSASLDANLFGMTGVDAARAYRFARGEAMTAANGATARLQRPLDFLVVADHAEYLGVMPLIRGNDKAMMASAAAREWRDTLSAGDVARFGRMMVEIGHSYETGKPLVSLPPGASSPWEANNRAADAANVPGEFTAFIGFEWTAMPGGDNLHRVVILRDGAERANSASPFSAFDSDDPEDLWRWLADYADTSGGDAIAIPHNSNLSGGRMFTPRRESGEALDAEYAQRRAYWEPLIEVTQIKGDSEAHPLLSPDDAFADYGTWDQFNINMSEPQQDDMQAYQYARPALQQGLSLERQVGSNPFRFGMIGSSDTHGPPGAIEEDNFWGKKAGDEPGPRRSQVFWGVPEAGMPNTLQVASGYAAVWAQENTRDALFDAMRRREVYATTGPRITVQFFAGWQLENEHLAMSDSALRKLPIAPMGARLDAALGSETGPRFLLRALKDPEGAHLDRLQIVKGWIDAEGAMREQVFNVAWSGRRSLDATGRLPVVGTSVGLDDASYSNSIGSAALEAVWQDPDFDAAQSAVYYARVLEIPTPHWSLYDKVRFGVKLPAGTTLTHQERAYTSPIWYTP